MLALVATSIYLAKREVDRRERVLQHLDSAEAEVQRAQDVIERVLRLVRGEPIHRETCRIADVIAEARRNASGASISIDVVPPDIEVSCEPLLVERLITNLLLNANEAVQTTSSPTITLRVHCVDEGFILEVEDNGPGFDAAVLKRLFEPGVTTKSTGTGVGLSLCRAIVRVHGGEMYVERASSGGALVRCVFRNEFSG